MGGGNDKGKRRRFGRIRRYASGKFSASYIGPDGIEHRSPESFDTQTQAEVWLSQIEADMTRQEWTDPDAGKVPFEVYAKSWLEGHPDIEDSTAELYERTLRNHLLPTFGEIDLVDIKEIDVRTWYKKWKERGKKHGYGQVTVAKSYRLLRAILNTAVDDGLIKRNPCRIKGGGTEKSPERPTYTIEQVYTLAEAVGPRWRVMVLLATFTSLRLGELAALRRSDIDLEARTIKIRRARAELKDGSEYIKDPKSEAGKRTLAMPEVILEDLARHMQWYAQPDPDGRVFVGPKGGRVRGCNWNRQWRRALKKVGLPYVPPDAPHFHDLRHTGNDLASRSGASLKELMHRMGHSTVRAAMIYQHATAERDREIADSLSKAVKKTQADAKARKAKAEAEPEEDAQQGSKKSGKKKGGKKKDKKKNGETDAAE